MRVNLKEKKRLFEQCMIGVIEIGAHRVHCAIFTDASLDTRIQLASPCREGSTIGVPHGGDSAQVHNPGNGNLPLLELIENEADILRAHLGACLRSSNHCLQRIFRDRGWRWNGPRQTNTIVRKQNDSCRVRMLNGNDHISVTYEVLNLSSVGEGCIRDSVGEEDDWEFSCISVRRSIGNCMGSNGTGDDQWPTGAKLILCCCPGVSVVVKLARTRDIFAGYLIRGLVDWVPDIDHQLAMFVPC